MISSARISAAHDGAAELVVTLRHGNGGFSDVTLDEAAGAVLFRVCHARQLEELEGHGWEKVKDALSASWNRFNKGD